MTTKAEILDLIRQLAAKNGKPPGMDRFRSDTGIGFHEWRGVFWSKWSSALEEAGLVANKLDALYDRERVVTQYLEACRKFACLATDPQLQMFSRENPGAPTRHSTWTKQFGGMAGLRQAAHAYAAQRSEWADVIPVFDGLKALDESTRRNASTKDGWVYLLKGLPGYYKIGRGDDLERRVKQISVAMPEKVELEHSISTDDPAGIEAYWHRRFANRRANGEWFKLTREDIRAFKRRRFQ